VLPYLATGLGRLALQIWLMPYRFFYYPLSVCRELIRINRIMLNNLLWPVKSKILSPYCDAAWCIGQSRDCICSNYECDNNISFFEKHEDLQIRIGNATITCEISDGICRHTHISWSNDPKEVEYPGSIVRNTYLEVEEYYKSYIHDIRDQFVADGFFDYIQHERCIGYDKVKIAIEKQLKKYDNKIRRIIQYHNYKTVIAIEVLFKSINWNK